MKLKAELPQKIHEIRIVRSVDWWEREPASTGYLLKRCHMSLQFLGETGVYLPQKDAIRITALTVGAHIGCFATRSALEAIGCTRDDPPRKLVDRFEQNRVLFEIAAMIKYRRSTNPKVASLLISDEDLKSLEPTPREAPLTSAAAPRKVRRRPAHLR